MDKDQFYLDEYKALRDEITTALKTRLDFNSWGLLGLGALYSYIVSNLDKPFVFPWLLWVPFALCVSMVWHLLDQHRMVAKAGTYISEQIEPWIRTGQIKGGSPGEKPKGWETFLEVTRDQKGSWTWNWAPVPLWCCLAAVTLLIALGFTVASASGWRPPRAEPPAASAPSTANNAFGQTLDERLKLQDAALGAKIAAAIDSLQRALDARRTAEDAALDAKIDAAQNRTDTKLQNLTGLINPGAIIDVLKALLSAEGGHSGAGPISISIDTHDGPAGQLCSGTALCCCRAEHAGDPACSPDSKRDHAPPRCR